MSNDTDGDGEQMAGMRGEIISWGHWLQTKVSPTMYTPNQNLLQRVSQRVLLLETVTAPGL